MKRYRGSKFANFINFPTFQKMSSTFQVNSRVVSSVVATKGRTGIITNVITEDKKRNFYVIWDGIDVSGLVSARAIKLAIPVPALATPAPATGGAQTTAVVENGEQEPEEDMAEGQAKGDSDSGDR